MSNNLAIKINKLFKSYDDVKAVQGIDLEINNQNNIKHLLELKNKLKPLCKNFVDFGNYFSENVELN